MSDARMHLPCGRRHKYCWPVLSCLIISMFLVSMAWSLLPGHCPRVPAPAGVSLESGVQCNVDWTCNVQLFNEIDTSSWSYGVDAFPSVAIGADGMLFVTFKDRLQFGVHDLLIANSSDHETFSTPRVVRSAYNINQHTSSLLVNGSGEVLVTYSYYDGSEDHVYFASSTGKGQSFLPEARVDPHAGFAVRPGIALNGSGLIVFYEFAGPVSRDIFLAASTDGGCSFPLVENVTGTATVNEDGVKMFIDGDGTLHALYNYGSLGSCHSIRNETAGTWTPPQLVTVPLQGEIHNMPALASDAAGNVIMVFPGEGNLRFSVSTDGCASWAAAVDVPGTAGYLNPSVAYDEAQQKLFIVAVDASVAGHWKYKYIVANFKVVTYPDTHVQVQLESQGAALALGSYTWLDGVDVDRDGAWELLAGSSDRFARMLELDRGNFTEWLSIDTGGSFPRAVAGFFDGDSLPDLAITSLGPGPDLAVLERDGNGTWAERASFPPSGLEHGAIGLARHDINGDGLVDVISPFKNATANGLHVHETLGNDSYTSRVVVHDGNSYLSTGIAVGDVDQDGLVEIITAPNVDDQSYHVVVWECGSDGMMIVEYVSSVVTGARALGIATGDTDGDGRGEIIIGEGCKNRARGTRVVVLENDGSPDGYEHAWDSGTLLPNYVLEDGKWSNVLVTVSDLTGDGHDEIIAGLGGQGMNTSDVFILTREGAGGYYLTASLRLPSRGDFVPVLAGDVDSDGVPEVVAGTRALYVYEYYQPRALARSPVLFYIGSQSNAGGTINLTWTFDGVADGFTVSLAKDGTLEGTFNVTGRQARSWTGAVTTAGNYTVHVAGWNVLGTGPQSNVVQVNVTFVRNPVIAGFPLACLIFVVCLVLVDKLFDHGLASWG